MKEEEARQIGSGDLKLQASPQFYIVDSILWILCNGNILPENVSTKGGSVVSR